MWNFKPPYSSKRAGEQGRKEGNNTIHLDNGILHSNEIESTKGKEINL